MLSSWLTGCAAKTYQLEQSSLRQAIIELYEEQLKDNLARAYEGLPFVHVTYKQMTGQVTIAVNGQFTANETNPPAVGITKVLSFLLGAAHSNQIQVISSPVTDNDSVYYAYTKFVTNERYFGRATKGEKRTELDEAHFSWERGGFHYYVKKGARAAFLDLIVQTTVASKTIEVSKRLFRIVREAVEITGQPGYPSVPDKKQHFLRLTLDEAVKNIDGTLTVEIEPNVERVFPLRLREDLPPLEDTKQVVLFYSEKDVALGHDIDPASLMRKLIGATVSLELRGLEIQRVPVETLDPLRRLQRETLEELRARPLSR
jgi:hypothetical protein